MDIYLLMCDKTKAYITTMDKKTSRMASKSEVKEEEIKHEIDPFGLMKVKVSRHLTEDIRQDMCTLLGLQPAVTENIKRGMDILAYMQAKGSLGPRNVDLLKYMLHTLEVQPAVEEVETYLRNYVSDEDKEQIQHTNIKPSEDLSQEQKILHEWQSYESNTLHLECSMDSFHAYDDMPPVLNLFLLGKTGSGKSATGNTILGRRFFKENFGSHSQTESISVAQVEEGKTVIKVIDTPGLFNTGVHDLLQTFQNRWQGKEIVKTVLKFPEGIHLFLIIYNPESKITKDDEAAIKHIEDALGPTAYDNCVLILTHSKTKFQRVSLAQFLENESNHDGKLSKIITAVNERVIAIDNSFEDALKHSKERNRLLINLAEVVSMNNADSYQHEPCIGANENLTNEPNKPEERFDKTEIEVSGKLEKYICQLLVSFEMNSDELKNPKTFFTQNVKHIMRSAEINDHEHSEEQALVHLNSFIEKNEKLVNDCIEVTQLMDDVKEGIIQKKKQEIKRKENLAKMETEIILFVDKVMGNSSPEHMKHMQIAKAMPGESFTSLLVELQAKSCLHNIADVQKFVTRTVFEDPSVVKGYMEGTLGPSYFINTINGNLVSAKATLTDECKAEERVHKYIPEFMRNLPEEDLITLKDALSEGDKDVIAGVVDKFMSYIHTLENARVKELCTEYLNTNANLIHKIIDILEFHRDLMEENCYVDLLQERRNEALQNIGEIIDKRLERYLIRLSVEETKKLFQELNCNKIPEEIFQHIFNHLFIDLNLAIEPATIQEEIMEYMQGRFCMILLLQTLGECFPNTCMVTTGYDTQISISSLKVGDEVLVYDSEGSLKYEKVYCLSHANRKIKAVYIEIVTQKRKVLLISPNHYLPINSLHNLLPAKEVAVNQSIFSVIDGVLTSDVIVAVSKKICKGAFCPMTMNGTIVVNDVAASCFTTIFNPTIGHALLFPVRVMYSYLPKSIFSTLLPYDQLEGMPILLAMCRSVIIFFAKLF